MSITHRFETFELLISSSSWNCIELYCPELHWTSKVPVSAVHRTEKRFDNEFRFRTSKILTESNSRSKCFELLEVNTSKWLLRITQSECLKLLETVRTARAFQGDYSKKFLLPFRVEKLLWRKEEVWVQILSKTFLGTNGLCITDVRITKLFENLTRSRLVIVTSANLIAHQRDGIAHGRDCS